MTDGTIYEPKYTWTDRWSMFVDLMRWWGWFLVPAVISLIVLVVGVVSLSWFFISDMAVTHDLGRTLYHFRLLMT